MKKYLTFFLIIVPGLLFRIEPQSILKPLTQNLPVELTAFTAQISSNGVILNWATATEVNNYGFEIQRSEDRSQMSDAGQSSFVNSQSSFVKIGFVNGSGNSNSPKSYSFTDNNLSAGKYSYRLKQIDNDGSFKYSQVVDASFMKPTKFELLQNYPNPFNPSTTIKFGLQSDAKVTLEVYNTIGQKVATLVNEQMSAGYHQVEFNASNLASGIYFYRITANIGNKDFNQVKKFILMK